MKIKTQPQDFIVEELIDYPIQRNGRYTVLRLTKRYWNTLDAIDFIARQLKLQKDLFSRAGLKDRYSMSIQYLSYYGSITKPLTAKNLTIEPIGRSSVPIRSEHLCGNSFKIVLRDLKLEDIILIEKNLEAIRQNGVLNYFDDQRFGSARHKKGFIARLLMKGHYQGALKLHLCYPHPEDGRALKAFKKHCRENWGAWHKCFELAPRSHRRLVVFLVENPGNFRSAFKCIDREDLNFSLLAYQSYIFNETLRMMVEDHCPHYFSLDYSMGKMSFCPTMPVGIRYNEVKIPMINHKQQLDDTSGRYIRNILEREGVRQKDFALQKMRFRGVQFKDSLRSATFTVKELFHDKPVHDEKYPNRFKMGLQFILPPGSYATLVLKRLIAKGYAN